MEDEKDVERGGSLIRSTKFSTWEDLGGERFGMAGGPSIQFNPIQFNSIVIVSGQQLPLSRSLFQFSCCGNFCHHSTSKVYVRTFLASTAASYLPLSSPSPLPFGRCFSDILLLFYIPLSPPT